MLHQFHNCPFVNGCRFSKFICSFGDANRPNVQFALKTKALPHFRSPPDSGNWIFLAQWLCQICPKSKKPQANRLGA
jgi:hypothetical protein